MIIAFLLTGLAVCLGAALAVAGVLYQVGYVAYLALAVLALRAYRWWLRRQ